MQYFTPNQNFKPELFSWKQHCNVTALNKSGKLPYHFSNTKCRNHHIRLSFSFLILVIALSFANASRKPSEGSFSCLEQSPRVSWWLIIQRNTYENSVTAFPTLPKGKTFMEFLYGMVHRNGPLSLFHHWLFQKKNPVLRLAKTNCTCCVLYYV